MGESLMDHPAESLTGGSIAQMAMGRRDPLLELPRISAGLEQFGIVIGLDDDGMGVGQRIGNNRGDAAQIGCLDEAEPFRRDDKPYRVHGIVNDGERNDLDVRELERLARSELLDPSDVAKELRRRLVDVHWNAMPLRKDANSIDVIRMLVRHEDPVDRIRIDPVRDQPLCGLPRGQTAIDEQTQRPRFYERTICFAATRQDGKPHASNLAVTRLRNKPFSFFCDYSLPCSPSVVARFAGEFFLTRGWGILGPPVRRKEFFTRPIGCEWNSVQTLDDETSIVPLSLAMTPQ